MERFGIQKAREEFADVVGIVRYSGEHVEITKHGKPVVKVVPVDEPVSGALELEPDLAAAVDAYADGAGLDRDAAIAALLRAGLATGAAATASDIANLFPEMVELDGEAAHEVILADQDELGEMVLYDYDGETVEYVYARARGRWIFTVSRQTDATDSRGCAVWEHDYTVCASRGEAQEMYRDAIITASARWREGTDLMWFDMLGGTVDELARDRAIPLGAFGGDPLTDDS